MVKKYIDTTKIWPCEKDLELAVKLGARGLLLVGYGGAGAGGLVPKLCPTLVTPWTVAH